MTTPLTKKEPCKQDAATQQITREAAEGAAKGILSEDHWHDQSIAGVADELEPFILSAMNKQGVAIQLTRGRFAVVSPEDADLSLFDWHCTSHGRAAKGKSEYMHKLIGERMGISGEVDHEDGNPLNNRRSNLRTCTRTQNQGNAGKHVSRGNTSKFKGVARSKTGKPWQAQIKKDGKSKYLGRFDNEEDAARAYDKAALEIFGQFARLNFP